MCFIELFFCVCWTRSIVLTTVQVAVGLADFDCGVVDFVLMRSLLELFCCAALCCLMCKSVSWWVPLTTIANRNDVPYACAMTGFEKGCNICALLSLRFMPWQLELMF